MKIFLGVPRLATGDGPGRAVAALHAIMGSIAACKRMLWYRSERIFPPHLRRLAPSGHLEGQKNGGKRSTSYPALCFLQYFINITY